MNNANAGVTFTKVEELTGTNGLLQIVEYSNDGGEFGYSYLVDVLDGTTSVDALAISNPATTNPFPTQVFSAEWSATWLSAADWDAANPGLPFAENFDPTDAGVIIYENTGISSPLDDSNDNDGFTALVAEHFFRFGALPGSTFIAFSGGLEGRVVDFSLPGRAPLPATAILMAVGLLGALWTRRRA